MELIPQDVPSRHILEGLRLAKLCNSPGPRRPLPVLLPVLSARTDNTLWVRSDWKSPALELIDTKSPAGLVLCWMDAVVPPIPAGPPQGPDPQLYYCGCLGCCKTDKPWCSRATWFRHSPDREAQIRDGRIPPPDPSYAVPRKRARVQGGAPAEAPSRKRRAPPPPRDVTPPSPPSSSQNEIQFEGHDDTAQQQRGEVCASSFTYL